MSKPHIPAPDLHIRWPLFQVLQFLRLQLLRCKRQGSSTILALGPDVVAVDGWSQAPKEEPYAHYRLKMRFTPGKGDAVKCEILAGVRVSEEEDRNQSSLDQEGALQAIYDRLRAKLSPKAREALKQEQLEWLKMREALSQTERGGATAHRAALLRARIAFP